MLLFDFFINNIASAVLNACLSTDRTGRKSRHSTSDKTTYFTAKTHVVIFLLKKNATNEVIAET